VTSDLWGYGSEQRGIVASGLAMRRVLATVERVARFKTSVLLLGESGVGKELVAKALHDRSPRRAAPFVAVSCATLGRELFENELFGHERGAFTGAHAQKRGLFELADGGTLFLDEIGEMELTTQTKLLRVLERSAFRRLGGTEKLSFDVSVVAATNRDLRAAIASGAFRDDLYYRLKVVTIPIPPLRERLDDIPALVDAFIASFNERHRTRIRGVTAAAMRRLVAHDWPGNVRELKNLIESAAMLVDDDVLDAPAFDEALAAEGPRRAPATPGEGAELRVPLPARAADVERALILATLERAQSRRDAAQQLGMGLRTLYAKLRAYGVEAGGAELAPRR